LNAFRYRKRFVADRGRHGEGSNRAGRNGKDLLIKVPPGTVIFGEDGSEVEADLTRPDQLVRAAAGGRGGRGNAAFATSTHQAPREAEAGEPGEERTLLLELKLIADVGIIGFPNSGKSTLISRISAARPKIADYPFTTLEPNLGVVDLGEFRSFVVADIPGLIAGAHTGQGLGIRFLRHVERTRALIHLVDLSEMSGRTPLEDLAVIDGELEAFSPELAAKPQIVAANKIDTLSGRARLRSLESHCVGGGRPFVAVSAVTGKGIRDLLEEVWRMIAKGGRTSATAGSSSTGGRRGENEPRRIETRHESD
jgi:GTP-binding protein